MRKDYFLITVFVFVSAVSFSQKAEIFSPDGVALKGYDVVAFFTEHMPVKGYDSLKLERNKTLWYFSSQQNLDSFKADTVKYIPQYGGYCAFGASRGYKAPTEVDTWTILDNKLYFNYNQAVKQTWDKEPKVYIKLADEKWPSFKLK